MKFLFQLRIRDVDCDFRLLRRSVFDSIELKNNSGVICVELVRKIQEKNFVFAEVPVHHFFRTYGTSQFFNGRRILRVLRDLVKLWWVLMICR